MQCQVCGHYYGSVEQAALSDPLPNGTPVDASRGASQVPYCPICYRNITNRFNYADRLHYLKSAFFGWLNRLWGLVDRVGRYLEPIGTVFLILYFMGAKILPPPVAASMKAGSYLIVLLLLISATRLTRLVYLGTRDILLIFLVIVTMGSILWTAAPAVTSDETKAFLRIVMFGLYLAARYTPREMMRLFAWSMAIGAVLSLIYGAAVPSGTHVANGETVWRGIFPHKQYLGMAMTLSTPLFILLALENPKYRRRWLLFALIAFVDVLFTKSKSSLIGLLFGISLIPFGKIVKQHYKARTIVISLVFLTVFYVVLFVSVNVETILVDVLEKGTDLNGRVPLWELAFEEVAKEPSRWFTGYGYAGFWTSRHGQFVIDNSWAATNVGVRNGSRFHAHSGFIDIFLQVGLIGTVPLFMSILTTIPKLSFLMVAKKEPEYLWMTQFVLVTCMYNFVEIPTYMANHPFWSFYVAIVLTTYLQMGQSAERPTPAAVSETREHDPQAHLAMLNPSWKGDRRYAHRNGYQNGHQNGYSNGHRNGHETAHSNGHRNGSRGTLPSQSPEQSVSGSRSERKP